MSETHVKGRVLYQPGIWGAARPAAGVKVEVLDQDVGNPDDVLWTGTTDGNGWFTADSDTPWRDRIKVQVLTRRPPFHEEREIDDPADVKLLMVRITEGSDQQTFAPLALSPGGDLAAPLVLRWGFHGAVTLPVNGTVHHAPAPGGPPVVPAQLARVRIEDRDTDGSVDLVFEGETDLDGRFGGMTLDARTWRERPDDAPVLTVTVLQGAHHQAFPAALVGDQIAIPPIVVPWGPGAGAATPCGASAFALGIRAAEIGARRGAAHWVYSGAGGGVAGCADPIPPWTVPPPDHTTGFGAVVATADAHAAGVRASWRRDPFDQLDDFRTFFPPFARPRVLDRYPAAGDVVIPDQEFADQRLAGANPLMLRRVNTPGDLPAAFGGGFAALAARCAPVADLAHLIASRQLFVVDYKILGDPPPVAGGKYMPCPFALFGAAQGKLAPIAIQIERHFDAQANPVVTPADADRTLWNIAKVMVQIADMNVHEMQSHLHDTHLAMEPFAVAMDRTMSRLHPISLLLQPHFLGMVAKNAQARDYLLAPVIGPVQRVLGLTLDGARAVVDRAAARWSFPAHALPQWLRDRGLDDRQALPEYPYRDDGLVIWNAISAFVTDYVQHTYADDGQITGCDTELQRWLAEVRAHDGGRRPSVPAVHTRTELAAVLTQILWTCSAQHSAVNTAQWDFMAFVPNMPGSAYARPLPSAQGAGETRLARILPGGDAAVDQTDLMWKLAGFAFDRLGRYRTTFYEPWATDVRGFGERLAAVEAELAAADGRRRIKYDFLRPGRIVSSINV